MASEGSLNQSLQRLLHAMNSLRKSQTFCDVFLMVGDRRIPAHRIVLAASSPVFKASLTSELKRQKEGRNDLLHMQKSDINLED
ncbi:Kelch-like protein 12 [Acropora cervicornis]|uniref:Kelch-like protein 12 n=1 Tax=Acropora cervicornis TaxID=6130 RepID=A0AAD9USG9_ACRCE|nr:Kelch-like protein 12 [Acropora cervicornis]